MPTTPLGIWYPDSVDHTRLWEHWQAQAESVDAALTPAVVSGPNAVITNYGSGWSVNSAVQRTFSWGLIMTEVLLTRQAANLADGARNYVLGDWAAGAVTPSVHVSTTARTTAGYAIANISGTQWELDYNLGGIAVGQTLAVGFTFWKLP